MTSRPASTSTQTSGSRTWLGAVLCLISAAGFGAMAIFGSLAYRQGVSTEALLIVRFSLAAVCVLALVLVRRPATPPAERRTLPASLIGVAFALGAVCYAAQAGFYFSALHHMDASLLALIFYTYPTLVTIAAIALGRDRLTRGRVGALVVASLGMLLVLQSSGSGRFDMTGVLLAFGAAVTYTVYILVSDTVVDRIPALTLSAWVMTGASVTLIIRSLATGGVDLAFGFWGWFWVSCIAVVSTVMAMALFFAGLRRTGPSTAAILSTFEPVVTTVLAGLVLAQVPTLGQVVGGLLVLVSVILVQERQRARPDEVTHLQATAAQTPGH